MEMGHWHLTKIDLQRLIALEPNNIFLDRSTALKRAKPLREKLDKAGWAKSYTWHVKKWFLPEVGEAIATRRSVALGVRTPGTDDEKILEALSHSHAHSLLLERQLDL